LADSLLYKGKENKRHEYLKNHLIGIEEEPFAKEIARLALTLTDIPNKDGWQIVNSNIYDTDILQETAEKATILLCNPPFENFSKEEKKKYNNLKTGNKAAEVLARTLPYMPPKSVFGVILPHGFLHKKNLAELRKDILDNFEIRTICNLPADNVFAKAGHPSTVLIGRKVKSNKKISYVRIHKSELETFKDSYQAKEEKIPKDDLYKAKDHSFRVAELKEIWDYCKEFPTFQEYVTIVRGIEYTGDLDINKKRSSTKFPCSQRGFYSYSENTFIDKVPELVWLNISEQYIKNKQSLTTNKEKILLNYIRMGRIPWRLSPWKDVEGNFCSNAFLSIIPKGEFSLDIIWAILTSPFANAYVHDHCMGKHNNEGVLIAMPVPFEGKNLSHLETLTRNYFELEQKDKFELKDGSTLAEKKKQYLLAIDAEIMRLYDLPPKLEKQLLDFFAGYQRKGVEFKFDPYYPEGFESWIPLHEYLSEEYQRSTVSFVKQWVEEVRSPEIIRALETATEDFGEE